MKGCRVSDPAGSTARLEPLSISALRAGERSFAVTVLHQSLLTAFIPSGPERPAAIHPPGTIRSSSLSWLSQGSGSISRYPGRLPTRRCLEFWKVDIRTFHGIPAPIGIQRAWHSVRQSLRSLGAFGGFNTATCRLTEDCPSNYLDRNSPGSALCISGQAIAGQTGS